MELPEIWIKKAEEVENKANYSRDYSAETAKNDGYIDGATDMLNAVEAAFKKEVASIQREHDRTDNLQYKSELNKQMEALTLLHFKLQYIKPL